jgi:class 3 adenylate cyclase/tetratricopeptide (TPR) repeat protein
MMSSIAAENLVEREKLLDDFGRPERAGLYVPRVLQQHLADDPLRQAWIAEGTAVFADVSGFTKLSEALAQKGREGAEQITETIEHVFSVLLGVAYERGGTLLKFGGDALLLWFHGEHHLVRACGAAARIRDVLRDVGTIALPDVTITLRISQGVHTGRFEFFAVGTSHRELLPVGPGWSRLAAAEASAGADQIVLSAETAAAMPAEYLGDLAATGRMLLREPMEHAEKVPQVPRPKLATETLARCLSTAIRAQVLAGGVGSEHRPVAIAFIKFSGTDKLIAEQGADEAAAALHSIVSTIQAACDEQDVAFLASDVDADGGKLILTAGAPKATGNDEERMLLALRKIVSTELPLPIRIGAHRGAVFAGDIGPVYRRTYTVMGDAVNLTARLMAKADVGSIYATADLLDRSDTHFETVRLEPFSVKGKTAPVQAFSVGAAKGSKTRHASLQKLPLTGRNAELGVIRKAFVSARGGAGRLIDVVGEAGMGKSRLLEALRDAATGFRKIEATCEAYTASTPYAVWRELLRELMEFGRDDPDSAVVERVRGDLEAKAPELMPWLPLIAMTLGIELEPTPEMAMLAESNRRAKLHESLFHFLDLIFPKSCLVEIENAHHMDGASADLLSHVAGELGSRPWLFAVAHRAAASGFRSADAPTIVRVELKPLAAQDALRMAQLATQQNPLPAHVLQVVATRSGGNPQFLRDLLRTAIESGGTADLPDSAEAAAMAQIDALAPEDRALVRRAAVFGLTFHPRMLEWFADEGEGPSPQPDTWSRLRELFDEEPDGYLRFRRSLLRDAAYEGLPYKLRRKLHGAVARHIEAEMDYPEESAAILSLHYVAAGEYEPTWRYARIAAERAEGAYAHVEAAKMYSRALEAARQLSELKPSAIAGVHESLGDVWYRASEYGKAADAYNAAKTMAGDETLRGASLMLKLSFVEAKLGNQQKALDFAMQAREILQQLPGPDAAKRFAEAGAWCANVLHLEGRNKEALEWAQRAAKEAEAADDVDSLGEAYFAMGCAYGELRMDGAEALMERSLEAFGKVRNLTRQVGVVLTLGVLFQWEGRWDEALTCYERARELSTKVGNVAAGAAARLNLAEILCDRGEWAEAETLLLETLPLWKSSQFRFFLAACLSVLGRVSLRLGRLDEAMNRLEDAKSHFAAVSAEGEVPPVDARIAECQVEMNRLDETIALADDMLARASESDSIGKLVPLVQRVKAHALIKQGDLWSARDALDASLESAREQRNLFESTLTMLSLIELDRFEGVEPTREMVEESRSLLAKFKVRAVPPVPRPPQ